MKRTNQNGFSMVELLLVLAIISILTAIALPNYSRMQGVARRVEGTYYLNLVKISQEGLYSQQDTYTLSMSALDEYGLPTQYPMKHYNLRFLTSNNTPVVQGVPVVWAYLCILTGNLDEDLTSDVLILKHGDPMIPAAANMPQGISVQTDDLLD